MRLFAPRPSYRVLSALARPVVKRLAQAVLIGIAALPVSAFAAQWTDLGTVSSTIGNNAGRLCIGGGRTDFGCPTDAPLLASGLLTVPGDLRVVGNLYVSGSQNFDGVTFTNGGISSTGTISATSISVNGQPVTVGMDDRITSGTVSVIARQSGYVTISASTLAMGSFDQYGNPDTLYIGIGTGRNNAPNVSFTMGLGHFAAGSNTGRDVVAVGFSAGEYNTGNNVVVVGNNAAANNTGSLTTALGSYAATNNKSDGATAVGYGAMANTTTGAANTAVGYHSMLNTITGSYNTAIGYAAGTGSAGSYSGNTFLGAYAGTAVNSGSSNTLIGYNAGAAITNGRNNIVIGQQTTPYSNTGNSQLNIGNAIWGDLGSGTGNANKVGINTTSPTNNFEVSGTSYFSNNVGIGTSRPSTTLHVSGTLKISNAGEACDANRLGAIRFTNGDFSICQSAVNGWESLATTGANSLADRISSNSQAGVIANSTGYISLTTGGVTGTVYFDPSGRLVNAGVSTTGPISTTSLRVYNTTNPLGYFRNTGDQVDLTIDSTVSGPNGNIRLMGGGGDNLVLGTSGSVMMVLASNSTIGIGTSYPSATFDVYSNIAVGKTGMPTPLMFRRPTDGTTATYFRYDQGYATSTSDFGLYHGTGGGTFSVNLNNNGATSPYMRVSGYDGANQVPGVIIGTSATYPSSTLHVVGVADAVSGGLTIGANTGNAIRFQLYPKGNSSMETRLLNGGVWDFSTSTGLSVARWDTITRGLSVGMSSTPSTTFQSAGSIRLGAESSTTLAVCDTNRLGAIKYESNAFYVCQNTTNGWEAMSTAGVNSLDDRITSNSQAGVIANSTGYISLTTGGVTGTVYFAPNGQLVTSQISTTGIISASAIQTYATTQGAFMAYFRDPIRSADLAVSAPGGNHIRVTAGAGDDLSLGASSTEAMRITSTGLVGIGTTTPSATLHVSGTNQLVYLGNGTNSNAYININDRGYIGMANGNNLVLQSGYGKGLTFSAHNGAAFGTSLTNAAFNITSNSLVGVGISTPLTALHVSGTLKITNGGESCDTDRLGAIKYQSSAFYICANTSNGWEPVATATSSTNPSISTGLSGSIVFRDEYGYLKAYNTFNISSTTGSVGIGGGAATYVGNNGLYATGGIASAGTMYAGEGTALPSQEQLVSPACAATPPPTLASSFSSPTPKPCASSPPASSVSVTPLPPTILRSPAVSSATSWF